MTTSGAHGPSSVDDVRGPLSPEEETYVAGKRPLSEGEIIGIVDHLYIGGNETTTFALTSGLRLMLSTPRIYDAVQKDLGKVKTLVEEALRLESPTQGLPRVAAVDTEVGGWPFRQERPYLR